MKKIMIFVMISFVTAIMSACGSEESSFEFESMAPKIEIEESNYLDELLNKSEEQINNAQPEEESNESYGAEVSYDNPNVAEVNESTLTEEGESNTEQSIPNGLSFKIAEVRPTYEWYRVAFEITNNTNEIKNVYDDDFVIKREGEAVVEPYSTRVSGGFDAFDNDGSPAYMDASAKIYPGEMKRASFDFATGLGQTDFEGYKMYYIYGNELYEIANLDDYR